jgi:hypothetical protein
MRNYLIFCVCFLLFKCDKKHKTPPDKAFKMYQMSEMSILMEQMYVDNMRLKNKIINHKPLGKFQDYFMKINSAKFTDSTDNNSFFKSKAKLFIDSQKIIYDDSIHAKTNFNKMVNACITCHEGNCGGPIVKIRKLLIPNVN